MLKDQVTDSINYVAYGLANHPLTYLNTAAIAVSMTNIEIGLKVLLYTVSIVASVLVSRKYLLEIRKLKKEEQESNDQK
jgi:hypothetical protein